MRRSVFAGLTVVALFGGVTSAAATGATLTGTVEVVATIKLSNNVPANAPLSATAGFFYDVVGVNQNGSVSASVKHSGKTATVTLHLPYRFTAPETPKMLGVTLTVSAQAPLTPYASVSVEMPAPANGATTVVKLPVSM
jgi:hypothetical protein